MVDGVVEGVVVVVVDSLVEELVVVVLVDSLLVVLLDELLLGVGVPLLAVVVLDPMLLVEPDAELEAEAVEVGGPVLVVVVGAPPQVELVKLASVSI